MQMQTLVADTSALVSLAIPRADSTFDTATYPDPLQYLLTACSVSITPEVERELRTMAQYSDLHATAAANVLAASNHYSVADPLARSDTPNSLPNFGLDPGETEGIVLANSRGVDAFLTDEFTSTNFTVIHSRLAGAKLVTTPRLLRDYAHAGHMTHADAQAVLTEIASHRSWENNAYVQRILHALS